MKKILAFTLILAMSGTSLFAQQTRATHKKKAEHGMEQGKKDAFKNLDLTDAQQKQLKEDNQSFKTKMEALNKEENITVKEQKTRKAALMAEQKAKRNALLTTDQKAKLAADRKALDEKHKKMAQKNGDKMQKELGLNNEQAVKLKAQNQATQTKVKAIQENTALSTDQKKEEMKILKESAMTDRKKILSVEQIQKMEEIKKAKKGRHHKKGSITLAPTF
ncbi:MAG: hypothetical protein WEA59_00470 [Ferruginibacter sp.]